MTTAPSLPSRNGGPREVDRNAFRERAMPAHPDAELLPDPPRTVGRNQVLRPYLERSAVSRWRMIAVTPLASCSATRTRSQPYACSVASAASLSAGSSAFCDGTRARWAGIWMPSLSWRCSARLRCTSVSTPTTPASWTNCAADRLRMPSSSPRRKVPSRCDRRSRVIAVPR